MMRSLGTALLLLMVCASAAYSQAFVTVRGSIQSLDSSRANMLVRSGGQDRLIILPATVPVTMQGDASRRLGVDDLTEGSTIIVDAVKASNGQLTARRVVVMPSMDGNNDPTGPSPANKVTVQPSRGASGGVVVTPDSSGASGARFTAARSNLLNQRVGAVHVNGRTVFRFRGVRGEDPYVRAQTVVSRLNSPAMASLDPSEVSVRRVNGQYAVVARGTVLITADATTARINRTSPSRLASMWAANVRAQLGEG